MNDVGLFTKSIQHRPDSTIDGYYYVEYDGNLFMNGYGKDSSGKFIYRNSVARTNGDKTSDTNRTHSGDTVTTKIFRYTYQGYDSLKNWLQQTQLDEKGKPVKIIKRKITYAKL